MRLYFIDVPYVSSGLKRTYHKKLEVFSGEYDKNAANYSVVIDTIYKFKKGEWVKSSYTQYREFNMYIQTYIHSSMVTLQGNFAFTSPELAQAAKLMLIQKMGITYKKKLKELEELFSRNVPNIDKPLQLLKKDYPEYFV